MLGFHASAHCIHRQFSQVLRVVVITRSEGVEATRKAIDWGFEPHIIVIGKEDVEATIELRGCQFMKVPRYKSATYQLRLGATMGSSAMSHEVQDCESSHEHATRCPAGSQLGDRER